MALVRAVCTVRKSTCGSTVLQFHELDAEFARRLLGGKGVGGDEPHPQAALTGAPGDLKSNFAKTDDAQSLVPQLGADVA